MKNEDKGVLKTINENIVITAILVMLCLFSVQSVSAVQVSENIKFQTPGTNTTFIMGNHFTFDKIEVHSTYLMLDNATISVCPSVGSIDFTLFNLSIEYWKWNESRSNPDATTNHTMGGLKTKTTYLVKVDGAIYGYYTSNDSGYVFFTYSGGYSDIVFEMEVADIIPPIITRATANPPTIEANGTDNTLLNVTATDESGIDRVTLNLSAIGGSANQAMVNNSGVWQYITNTTKIGNFQLQVNATDNAGNSNISVKITLIARDTTPPASITNLQSTFGQTWINWTWKNPSDSDFNYTMVYLDGEWKVNTSAEYYNATGLSVWTEHTISTRTVDKSGNINATFVNSTASTLEVLCGDVNNNGEVTISDAMLLANNVSFPSGGYILKCGYSLKNL